MLHVAAPLAPPKQLSTLTCEALTAMVRPRSSDDVVRVPLATDPSYLPRTATRAMINRGISTAITEPAL
jgi:hypothetical protein